MVTEKREFLRVHTGGFFRPTEMIYEHTLICPARRKFLGFLATDHDKITIEEAE